MENYKDKVIGINVDNSKSLVRVGEIVSIYSPLINPFTLQSSGPDKTRLKGRAIIESIDKNYAEIRTTYIADTQISSGDIVVAEKSGNVVIGEWSDSIRKKFRLTVFKYRFART